MNRRFIAAFSATFIALALASSAIAREAVVGRESDAKVRARIVQLVNDARARGRRCGTERFAATRPLNISRPLTDAAADPGIGAGVCVGADLGAGVGVGT